MTNNSLGLKDYLDASTDASKRTRTITIILAVASILAFTALLNSLQSQWMHRRMVLLADINGDYLKGKIGEYPRRITYSDEASYQHGIMLYESRYKELYAAVERAYVENSFVVRVPFLGFAFDINDLGLIGGIGFFVILSCHRFFLSREINNLRLSFEAAKRVSEEEVEMFYNLLAMRQVFTVPQTQHINRSTFLVMAPKLLTWLPLVIYVAITLHDLTTATIGKMLEDGHYRVLITSEVVFVFALLWLSYSVSLRLSRMDRVWDIWRKHIDTKHHPGRQHENNQEVVVRVALPASSDELVRDE
jgi:hypothetical protein